MKGLEKGLIITIIVIEIAVFCGATLFEYSHYKSHTSQTIQVKK